MKFEFPSYSSYSTRKLREFGGVWAVFFVLLAAGSIWKSHWHLGARTIPYLLIAGVWLLFAGLAPRALRPLLHAWMLFGTVAGHVMTTVILALLYAFVVTPMGFLTRVRGSNLLDEGLSAERKSYWIPKHAPPPGHFRRLFVVDEARRHAAGGFVARSTRTVAASVLGLCIVFAYAEVGLRAYQKLRDGRPLLQAPRGLALAQPDDVLGWRPFENQQISGQSPMADGTLPPFHVTYEAHGFRQWGDPSSSRPRVLAIGDSFTWAESIDDHDTWFHTLGDGAGVEMFAYGGGGWGTLQEALALERFIGAVHPDVVVLQMTGNDFINNSAELEWQARGNNRTRRPFWNGDHIEYVRPVHFPHVRAFAELGSRAAFFILFRYDRAMAARPGLEDEIQLQGPTHPGFARAAEITRVLLRRFKQSAGNRPVMAFMVRKDQPQYDTAARLCREEGLIWDDNAPAAVDAARNRGDTTLLVDGHWSARGHLAAGQALVPGLKAIIRSRVRPAVQPALGAAP